MKICSGCRRHVRARESACPFCGEAQRSNGAVILGAVVLLGGACSDRPIDDTQSGSSTEAPASSSSSSDESSSGGSIAPTTTTAEPPTTSTGSTTTAGESSSSSSEGESTEVGGSFYGVPTDVGPSPFECDPYSQDCPRGEKCAPWISGDGTQFNALKCVPVVDDPALPGEPCVTEDKGSGLDDCAQGSVCQDLDDQNMGTCVAQCTGTPAEPVCPAEMACAQFNGGALDLCVPTCDPLMPECADGDLCLFNEIGDHFLCVVDISGEEGQVNDPCEFLNACDPGLVCVASASAKECDQAASGCCQAYCDTTLPDPDSQCAGQDQVCQPFFDMPPMGQEDIGVCTVPM